MNDQDNLYIALIGDVVKSKEINPMEREQLQVDLASLFKDINERYKRKLVSPLTITLGDEFQGLFVEGDSMLEIIDEIRLKTYPVRVRFGLGFGTMSTAIRQEDSLGSDGPAYYCARKAIEQVKQRERAYKVAKTTIRVESNQVDKGHICLLNAALIGMCAIDRAWAEKERSIARYLREKRTQNEIAKKIKTSQANISSIIFSKNIYYYNEIFLEISESMHNSLNKEVVENA